MRLKNMTGYSITLTSLKRLKKGTEGQFIFYKEAENACIPNFLVVISLYKQLALVFH